MSLIALFLSSSFVAFLVAALQELVFRNSTSSTIPGMAEQPNGKNYTFVKHG
jgi:hypothetical protein